MNEKKRMKFIINAVYFAVFFSIAFIAAKVLINWLLPFVMALIIALCVQKPSLKLSQKTGIKKGMISAFLAGFVYILFVTMIALFIGIIAINFEELLEFASVIFEKASVISSNLQKKINNSFGEAFVKYDIFTENFYENAFQRLSTYLTSALGKIFKNLPKVFLNFVIALVASCYIAKDFDILKKFYRNLFGVKAYLKTVKVKTIIENCVFKMAKGYIIILFVTFLELILGFMVLRIKNAVLLAVLIAFVDLLPILGTGTVLLPWGIIEILLSHTKGFGLIALYFIITLIRNFIEPKIIGKQMGINPLFTLAAMFLGLKSFGFLGLLTFPIVLIVTIRYFKEDTL